MSDHNDSSTKAVISALIGNSLITVFKFIGWLVGHSPSMLAESVHSLADVVNQLFLLIGISQSKSGPSDDFQWGLGGARYLWNLMSALGIFFIGGGVSIYHGIDSLLNPRVPESGMSFYISLLVLFAALLIDGYTLWVAWSSIEKNRGAKSFINYLKNGDDPTVVGVFLEDLVATMAVVLAIIGITLSQVYKTTHFDSATAIGIGLLLCLIAVFLGLKNARFLLGSSIDKKKGEEIKEFVESLPSVEKVVSMRTEVLSPGKIHLVMEVEFHGSYFVDRDQIEKDAYRIENGDPIVPILVNSTERAIRRLGREINEIEKTIRKKFPEVTSIDLEVN